MALRKFASTAVATTLSSGVTASGTSFVIGSATGWPSTTPYTIIVDPDLVTMEVCEVTARVGTTLTVTRGVDGTTGVIHSSGAVVRHGVSARDFSEPNTFLNSGGTVGGNVSVTGSVTGTSLISSGGVSGTTGTFSSGVSGTTGAFSSAVSGTTGTFTGTVTHPLGAVGTPSLTFAGDTNTGIYSPTADNISLATGGVQRLNIDSAGLVTGTGTTFGTWTSFTPTISGTGWALGNGITTGYYVKIGKTVSFRAAVTFGSTSTYGTGVLSMSLPFAANANNNVSSFGANTTVSGANVYALQAQIPGGSGSMQFYAIGTGGVLSALVQGTPGTYISGTTVQVTGTYEAV